MITDTDYWFNWSLVVSVCNLLQVAVQYCQLVEHKVLTWAVVIEEEIIVIEAGLYKVDYRGRQDIYRYCRGQEIVCVCAWEMCVGWLCRGGGGGSQRKNTQELWLVSFPGKKGKVKRWPPNKWNSISRHIILPCSLLLAFIFIKTTDKHKLIITARMSKCRPLSCSLSFSTVALHVHACKMLI